MASRVFNNAKARTASGDMDLNSDDMRVVLCMTNTTTDTENDAIVNTSNFTTLDEMDGANYARQALVNEAVVVDDANDRAEFDADDVTINSLGNGTRQIQTILIHEHIVNDAGSFPFCVHDITTINPGGANFTIQWNAEGIAQLA